MLAVDWCCIADPMSRKRCMDLVSFETQQEYDWVKGFIDGGVQFFWTSGR